MAEVMSVGARLLSYWKEQAIRVRPPAAASTIKNFEEQYGVTLPEDVRNFYEHADGFDQIFDPEKNRRYQDKNGFNFYPLSKVVPVDSIDEGRFSFPGSNDYYIFADYLDWCWGYAFRLLSSAGSRVVMIGKAETSVSVSETFADFVDSYIADHSVIYRGASGDESG
jgi:hypothetical protein